MTVNDRWRVCFESRDGDAYNVRSPTTTRADAVTPAVHPGRLLRRELDDRGLSPTKLGLALGVPASRIAAIARGRRGIDADTAVRLGRYFGNRPQFWLDLQGQYEIALVERERGAAIAEQVRPADAA